MELSTNLVDILMQIPDLYETDGQKNPTAYLKFFNPLGKGTWYVTEMGATDDKDVLLFGYVESPIAPEFSEWGYFLLSQLLETGIIELDKYFKPTPINDILAKVEV